MKVLSIPVGDASVSGILMRPENAKALYLFAHGAGAGMAHKNMASNALGLAQRGVATLRYQFPYMERGSKRPDVPRVAQAAVRAAAAEAMRLAGDLPLFAGGRSFGGRMTSQAQADAPLPGVIGLVFLGFPLHPAGKPGIERAEHLSKVQLPMLFVTGSRDSLASMELLEPVVADLGPRARLHVIEGADHSLGTRRAESEALDVIAEWIFALA